MDDSYSTVNGGYNFVAGVGSKVDAPSLAANDSDPDNNHFDIELVSGPANGTLNLQPDGTFSYVANPSFVGVDTFTYRASDGLDATEATATINVQNADTYQIVASADTGAYERSASVNYGGSTSLLVSDDDDGDDDFNFAYFKFDISQLDGQVSEVSFDFTPTTAQSGTFSIHSIGTDWDESTLTYANRPATGASLGNASQSAAGIRQSIDVTKWIRDAKAAGQTEVSLRLSTSNWRESAVASRESGTLEHRPVLRTTGVLVNRAPEPQAESYATINGGYAFVAGAGSKIDAPKVIANDSDPDHNLFSISLVTNVQNGTLDLRADGSFTYVANADFVGTDQFTYRLDDGMDTSDATVTIDVLQSETIDFLAQNDARISEANRASNYGNASTIPINDNDDGDGDYEHGYFKFDLSQLDGELWEVFFDFTPTVAQVNRSLVLHSTGDDWDESTITYDTAPGVGLSLGTVTQSASNVRHSIDVTRHIRQTLAAGETEISFRLSQNGTSTAHVASSEHPVLELRPTIRTFGVLENRAPTPQDDSYSTVNNGYVFVAGPASKIDAPNVLANDSDPDLNNYSVSLVTGVQNGTLDFKSDGTFTYVADTSFVGTDQFTYRVGRWFGHGGCDGDHHG